MLRAVVFCTEDLLLIKGPGRIRRRFLDLLLAQTHATYLPILQRYTQALRARNALLKRSALDEAALEGFSVELVKLGNQIIQLRRELAPRLSPLVRLAYRRISDAAEDLRIEYQPNVQEDLAVELAQSRSRERTYRSTLIGPPPRRVQLLLNDRPAAHPAAKAKTNPGRCSQAAQAEYLTGLHGSPPILLIDDVMGELTCRRSAFLLLQRARQAHGQVSRRPAPRKIGHANWAAICNGGK